MSRSHSIVQLAGMTVQRLFSKTQLLQLCHDLLVLPAYATSGAIWPPCFLALAGLRCCCGLGLQELAQCTARSHFGSLLALALPLLSVDQVKKPCGGSACLWPWPCYQANFLQFRRSRPVPGTYLCVAAAEIVCSWVTAHVAVHGLASEETRLLQSTIWRSTKGF